jgi:O-antigen ligase
VKIVAFALGLFFTVVQFYTSFAALSPTPPVGYVFATRPVAALLVTLLALAALVLGAYLIREHALFGRSPSHALLAAWTGSALLSSLLGLDPGSGLQVTAMMALGGCFHLALVRAFGGRRVPPAVLLPYLLAGTAATVAGLIMDVLRRPALLWVLNHGRAAGLFVTANQFAAFVLAFGFVAFGTALAFRGALRALGAAGAASAALALVATLSLAGLLGAAVAAIFYAFALGARRSAGVLALVAALGFALVVSRPALAHNPADQFVRLRFWEAGLRVAALFPLTGAGPMAYWRVYPAVRAPDGDPPGTFGALHPHDAYLSLAGETGLVGLAAAAFGWVTFVRSIRARLRMRTAPERRFVLAVCAALVAVLVQGVFDTIGIVQMCFVWIPYTALAVASASAGLAQEAVSP